MEVDERVMKGCRFGAEPPGVGAAPLWNRMYDWEYGRLGMVDTITEILKQVCRDEATAELYR